MCGLLLKIPKKRSELGTPTLSLATRGIFEILFLSSQKWTCVILNKRPKIVCLLANFLRWKRKIKDASGS